MTGEQRAGERPWREAEYLAYAEARLAQFADQLSKMLAGHLPEGVRFEYVKAEPR